ncbi:MAG: hypothetical protein OXE59_12985 [Bacteroidetes bacterium]|nr:hypothetical protein [Bacteroidota bacterium]
MKKNKFIGRLILPVIFPLVPLHSYWSAFDGAHTETDLLWGVLITVASGVAIFLYEPFAKKTEHFSLAWFFMLSIVLTLLGCGFLMSDIYFPLPLRAWGNYAMYFAISLAFAHQLYHYSDKPRKEGSFFKRITFKT